MPRSNPFPPETEAKLAKAYAYWKNNPNMILDDLFRASGGNRRDLNIYMKLKGLGRPDGRVIGKESPRQVMLKKAYEAAKVKDETTGWAERYAEAKGFKIGKGDFRYYAMKNDLPYLREGAATIIRQESPSKLKI